MDKKVPGKLPIKYYSSVKAKNIEWLWYPYIPYGKITIIQGDPGDGKTTLVLNIAAFLSNGQAIPNTDIKLERNKIIYQSAENTA